MRRVGEAARGGGEDEGGCEHRDKGFANHGGLLGA
jgi:hypothetical protein